MTDTARQAREVLIDAHTIAATIDAALRSLDQALAGWPTSTPGAAPAEGGTITEGWCDEIVGTGTSLTLPGNPKVNIVCDRPLPCPDHPTIALSIVERTAGTDRARRILEQLHKEIRTAYGPLHRAASICQAWGTPLLDKSTVAARISDSDLWCKNCVNHGFRNPRDEDKTECSFCGDIRRDWSVSAPKDLIDLHTTRRVYETDIIRILDRHGLKWKRKKKLAS